MFNEESIILRILAPFPTDMKKICCCKISSIDVNNNEENVEEPNNTYDTDSKGNTIYEWGLDVKAGDILVVEEEGYPEYLVLQDHTTQSDWPLSSTPALYKLQEYYENYLIWTPTLAIVDQYNTGDLVAFSGDSETLSYHIYKSLIDANTTIPGTDDRYWELI